MLFDREHYLAERPRSAETDSPVAFPLDRDSTEDPGAVVLYAGTFEPYQGLEILVDASPAVLRARSEARFVCLGGSYEQIAAIKARAEGLGVGKSFFLPGTVAPEDVETHFRMASVLVSPRIAGTNTPLKIYSYLRSGIPIVATNIRSHTQVLTPDVALLVEPSAQAVASGIVRLLEDSELSQRLVRNALRLARERYSREAYYEKVSQVVGFLTAKSQKEKT